jgi:hypothetical protein
MDALEAVIDLVKQNDDLVHTVDTYEEWFESLVGRAVTISHTHKKKTEFITGEVEEFEPGEGWIVRCIENDEVMTLTFEDILDGRAWIIKKPEPVKRPKRSVQFQE